ncbi:hypothetical protein TIFTF001_001552 [Ficus carica]|uniref:snRNA-activating protein complex subunit n=1 Tax=Ficus carica TaxID=3494 RepID=A0AA87Z0Q5_FICCA|nr:hypothetical protein TIFTF001_001552 [Ficus carica]
MTNTQNDVVFLLSEGTAERDDSGGEKQPNNAGELLSIPRGGPLYVPNLVSPLTSIHLFQSSLLPELQDLEVEISSKANLVLGDDDEEEEEEDISVDELKIFTEEELVDMAMKEAFKEGEDQEKPSILEDRLSNNEEKEDNNGISNNEDACKRITKRETNGTAEDERISKCSSRKKQRRTAQIHAGEYIAKVEELAEVKKKQDEDKAAVRLHSFNCRTVECATPSSEKIERMKPLRYAAARAKVKSSNSNEYVGVKHPEVALSIEVYHNVKRWVKTQEFLVLGRQTLTELRDKIYCITDQDVFCNDLRDPTAIDYSEPIFDWLRNNKDEVRKKWECIITGELQQKQKAIIGDVASQLPHFKSFDMQKTRFCDLKFRLGAGYQYCHQGDCKHTIVIRDMRLVHPEDVQNQAAYPIVVFQLKPRVQKCHVCKIYRATKVTVDDKWAQGNPCYFCDNCYYLLHYKDGSLVYSDFSVYDYLHD